MNYKLKQSFSPERSPLLYLLPMILFMGIMIAFPIGRVFYLSLMENQLTRPELGVNFVGLDNYLSLLLSNEFWATLFRTVGWTSLSVILKVAAGFGIAWLLAKEIGFKKVYMFLLMVPWVTPMVVAAVSFRWIYDGEFGTLNYILRSINLIESNIQWLGKAANAFMATAIVDMWLGLPFMVLMFLAGLQSIPKELKESANIDGANGMQVLRHIILPMMKPIILVATTLSTIWTFNSFGVIWPMTRGGPVDATTTLVVEAYVQSFGSFDLGMGAAIAVVIFVFLMLSTIVYRRLLLKQEQW
ncbi:carbohydrate ABC transporter permease [Alteribacillus sp. HJP-4]|uniref:carbohydrate ABC transporter permease n=1 Tax=Alteribacillus sp. HJP-4 TaxID=2775394 RepID=UPI0035CCCB0F